MILFIIALLLIILGYICRARLSKRLLWISAALVLLAASSFLWVDAHFAAAGCEGNAVLGLICPDPGLLTQIALAHAAFGFFALAGCVFAAPMVVLIALALEARYRRKETA